MLGLVLILIAVFILGLNEYLLDQESFRVYFEIAKKYLGLALLLIMKTNNK
jgi:hypothetical protein